MTKKLEKSWAEVIMVIIIVAVVMSSCGSTYTSCAAYANVEVKNELKWRN